MYPQCPKCKSNYTYEDSGVFICPECAHEWNTIESTGAIIAKDANGTTLTDGDSVTLIKDLKSKGTTLKQGIKIKNIRLQDGNHNIICKINGSTWELKSEFVKKI